MLCACTKVNYQKMYLIAYRQIQVQILKNKNNILWLNTLTKKTQINTNAYRKQNLNVFCRNLCFFFERLYALRNILTKKCTFVVSNL